VGEQIKPKVIIPMHFKTEKCGFPIAPVDDFLKGKSNIKRPKMSEVTFDQASLPSKMEIVVLEHAFKPVRKTGYQASPFIQMRRGILFSLTLRDEVF
jgi:hypothetical protein